MVQSVYAAEVSVVLPVYRNADTLPELYKRLRRVLEGEQLAFELLFVDDACPAGSLQVLQELAEKDPRVAALALTRNIGQHRAVLVGLAHALGKLIVVMDADLQDPPEAIPALLAVLRNGPAAVFAARRGRFESTSRYLTSWLFKHLNQLLTGVPPDAGLFVAMNRAMVERLLAFDVRRPYVVGMIGCAGLPLASVPVSRARRPSGRSAYTFRKRFTTGCSGLAWAVSLRLRTVRRVAGRSAREEPVMAHIGARFSPPRAAIVDPD